MGSTIASVATHNEGPMEALQRVFDRMSAEERSLMMRALGSSDARGDYIAWLEARGDVRAEALGLEPRLREHELDAAVHARLRALLETIDPDWWWVMSPTRIHNCGASRDQAPRVRFRLVCTREWAALEPTGEPNARRCDGCRETVYRCATGAEANERAVRGQCIAVDGALACDQATDRPGLFVGRPDFVAMWAERLFPANG